MARYHGNDTRGAKEGLMRLAIGNGKRRDPFPVRCKSVYVYTGERRGVGFVLQGGRAKMADKRRKGE